MVSDISPEDHRSPHSSLDTWTLDVWKLSKCLECLMVFNEKFQMSNWPSKCRILVEKFQTSSRRLMTSKNSKFFPGRPKNFLLDVWKAAEKVFTRRLEGFWNVWNVPNVLNV